MNYFSNFSSFFLILLLTGSALQCNVPEKSQDQVETKQEKETISDLEGSSQTPVTKPSKPLNPIDSQAHFIKGHYSYFADSHTFILCGEKKGMPIVANKQRVLMEKAYMQLPNLKTAEKVFLRVEGTFIQAKNMENIDKQHLEVTRFLGFERPLNCDS